MGKTRNFSAVAVSAVVHFVFLFALSMIQQQLMSDQPDVLVETVFEEERVQEEFDRDLEDATDIAETQNIIAGGLVTTAIGGSNAPAVAQEKIEVSESLKEPDVQVNVSAISIPGETMLGEDLGEEEVSGEVGAVVSGYGAALSRITQELIRMMRSSKVMAVWLFDESFSMKDDQKELSAEFHKVYEELGIQLQKDEKLRRGQGILLTAVVGFGKDVHELTAKPTDDINKIRAAIDKIPIDESGDENMCTAIAGVVDKYGKMARAQRRRLAIIVVSDESPTDDNIATGKTDLLEPTIEKAKRANAPVYVLGRVATFGYPFARYRWVDPKYNLPHWVWIDRGPETGFPECLQYNGLHAREDAFSSGFGPYSQVRICRETGGIFFLLPGEEENLVGAGVHEKRRFEFLAMKEYQPLLLPRREYAEQRQASDFRTALWNVIVTLNPHIDKELNIRWWHYPLKLAEFKNVAAKESQKAMRAMKLLAEAVTLLSKVEPFRAREESKRWRADFDLILAQCYTYQVRLFQYLLAIDNHVNHMPKPRSPKNNEWAITWNRKMIVPDDAQFARLKAAFNIRLERDDYLKLLKQKENTARELFAKVKQAHPGTPWARVADHELHLGFSIRVYDRFHDPNYSKVKNIPKF